MLPPFLLVWMRRLDASRVGSKLASGMMWSVAGAVASRGLALLASIVTARLIGREEFGALGVMQSTLSMFSTFALFGLNLTATKHIAEYRTSDPARAGRILSLSLVMAWCSGLVSAVLMAATASSVARLLAAPQLSAILSLSAVALLFLVVNHVQLGGLAGFEAFRRISLIQALAGAVSFPLNLGAVWLWGLPGAVLGMVLSSIVLVTLSRDGLVREALLAGVPLSRSGWSLEKDVLWRFSFPTLLGGAVYVPVMWVANIAIVNTPEGYSAMGLFSAADRWRTMIMFIPVLMGGVTLPLLTGLRAEGPAKYHKVLWISVGMSGAAAASLAIPISVASPYIMNSYGPGFGEGQWALVALCVSAVASSSYWIVSQSLISRTRVWALFWLNVEWAIVFLGSVWMLRHLGATGLAVAYLISDSLRLGTSLILIQRWPDHELAGPSGA